MRIRRKSITGMASCNYHRILNGSPTIQLRILATMQKRDDVLSHAVQIIDFSHLASASETFNEATDNFWSRESAQCCATLESPKSCNSSVIFSPTHVQLVDVTPMIA